MPPLPTWKTTTAVDTIATELGIDKEHAKWAVIAYGARDDQVHATLSDMRKQGHYTKLAELLFARSEGPLHDLLTLLRVKSTFRTCELSSKRKSIYVV